MINITEKNKCCGCSACFNICPKGAIEMKPDEKGFLYPRVDKSKCINCNLCVKVCPIQNKIKKEKQYNTKSYACINKDNQIREKSSSGGIFSLLAQEILKENGVVYGAAYTADFSVKHVRVDNLSDLDKLYGSKYVQSNIGTIYKNVKCDLEKNKKVLFTGTPCQINGLYGFLNKKYDNLYTQDLICHGVPSPEVWKEYLKRAFGNKKIKNVEFRNKDVGWHKFSFKVTFEDETNFSETFDKNIYMKLFLKDVILRDSCYSCDFKEINRISDITLADFWGVEKIIPKIDDDRGISLVILNTDKGQELFNKIKNNVIEKEINIEEAIRYNLNMVNSAKINKNSKRFFLNYKNGNMIKLSKKMTKNTLKNIIIKKGKSVIKKVIRK